MSETVTPKFCTLLYSVLQELHISVAEYVYTDMVYYLSRNGWCYKSLENIAKDMGMRKSAIYYMRNRLIEKRLIEMNGKKQVRTTYVWHDALANHPYNVQKMNGYNNARSKSTPPHSITEPERSKTDTKIYNRTTKEIDTGKGYKFALEVRNKLKEHMSL